MNINAHLNQEGKARIKIGLKNKEIKYFIVNERGRIVDTGEIQEEKVTYPTEESRLNPETICNKSLKRIR